jgi:hypothetical protein
MRKQTIFEEVEQKGILDKYFSIQDNQATFQLVYDTFSELVDNNFGEDNVERLNTRLFDDVENALFILPKKYKAHIQIKIRDLGRYTLQECEQIIKENIILHFYSVYLSNRRKKRNGLILCGVGVVLLLASYFTQSRALPEILFDIINISGTLFVWEGVSVAYLERNESKLVARRMAKTILSVSVSLAEPMEEK